MKREEDELQKHTLQLFKGDYARAQELFPQLGGAKVVRTLLRKFLEKHIGKTELDMDIGGIE